MNFKGLKYIFLFVAFSLNVIHGFVPHSHDNLEGKSEIQIDSASDSSDFLKCLFGFLKFNLGEDHLDKFVRLDNEFSCQLHNDLLLINQFDTLKIDNPEINKSFGHTINEPSCLHSFASIITRGPPATNVC